MGKQDWPTLEEFKALQQLVNEGKVTAIAELIEKDGVVIHRCIVDALKKLDHWDNNLRWQITETPKASQAKIGMAGRPSSREKDPLHAFRRYKLAMKVAEAHIHYIEIHGREPNLKEVREFILNDKDVARLTRFSGKGRTTQDKMVADAKLFFEPR